METISYMAQIELNVMTKDSSSCLVSKSTNMETDMAKIKLDAIKKLDYNDFFDARSHVELYDSNRSIFIDRIRL